MWKTEFLKKRENLEDLEKLSTFHTQPVHRKTDAFFHKEESAEAKEKRALCDFSTASTPPTTNNTTIKSIYYIYLFRFL